MSGRVIGTYCLGFFAAAITSIQLLLPTLVPRAGEHNVGYNDGKY